MFVLSGLGGGANGGVAPMVGVSSRKQWAAPSRSSEGMQAGVALIAHPRSRSRPLGGRWIAQAGRSRPRWGWESLRTFPMLAEPCFQGRRVPLDALVSSERQYRQAAVFRNPRPRLRVGPAGRDTQPSCQFPKVNDLDGWCVRWCCGGGGH